MQAERDSEDSDADPREFCPICTKELPDHVCEDHNLGCFIDGGEGEYGIGLCDGALYGVNEIMLPQDWHIDLSDQ